MSMVCAPTLNAVVPLSVEAVERVWGRMDAGDWGCGVSFAGVIGELHHSLPADAASIAGADALLVKTLFTSAMLSVQVHPDAPTARAMGMPCGKDEAWVVLAAQQDAVIGLGLRMALSAEALADAVADGSIIDKMCWHKVAVGDVLSAPAGTVHAIGAGVTVFELQENNDLTWRLYDHGRGRKLDVAAGLGVACRKAYAAPAPLEAPGPGRVLLVAGGGFVLEPVSGDGVLWPQEGRPAWVAALSDGAVRGSTVLERGRVALVSGAQPVRASTGLLLAQAGPLPHPGLWELA